MPDREIARRERSGGRLNHTLKYGQLSSGAGSAVRREAPEFVPIRVTSSTGAVVSMARDDGALEITVGSGHGHSGSAGVRRRAATPSRCRAGEGRMLKATAHPCGTL